MDPLSVAASVITLVDAASKLYHLLQSIREADEKLEGLCTEIGRLTSFLRAINQALEKCRNSPFSLTTVDQDLWEQSEIALSDCKEIVDEMTPILYRLKTPVRSSIIFRRARIAAGMQLRARENTSFQGKIRISNWTLQTLLQVMNVSISLRSSASQDVTLRELKELKTSLQAFDYAVAIPSIAGSFQEQDIRLIQHFKGFVRAAREFHANASTTASTISGSQEHHRLGSLLDDVDATSDLASPIPSVKRRHIEMYLSRNVHLPQNGNLASISRNQGMVSETPFPDDPELVAEESPSDFHFILGNIFSGGLSKIAERALAELDFKKAGAVLREALKQHKSSGLDDIHHRGLQTKLALSTLIQGETGEAEDLIYDLAEFPLQGDIVICQLLYALALSQLHELKLEATQRTCKRLWQRCQGPRHCAKPMEDSVLTLLAISYRLSGNYLMAEAIEVEVPRTSGFRIAAEPYRIYN
ncbi:hypothetical protein F5B20DRAFT_500153 [Whalleya microplaca]|nr:hypothetical protein F5B20DRAFT_500153 [Whalleya microplaca]